MKVIKLWFSDECLFIEKKKKEVLSQKLHFYPRLKKATNAQREEWKQSYGSLHWETIDEDISFESFYWSENDPLRLYHQEI
jgi:hypothetical protein